VIDAFPWSSYAAVMTQTSLRFATVIGLAVVLCCGCAKAPRELTLLPVDMNPTGQHTTTSAGGVTFWGNGALQSNVAVDKGPVSITVRALGNLVDGEVPILNVSLEGRKVGKLRIDSNVPKDFTIKTDAQDSGTLALKLSFNNHIAKPPDDLHGRWLVVELVTVG
jgi:hypothetical protein